MKATLPAFVRMIFVVALALTASSALAQRTAYVFITEPSSPALESHVTPAVQGQVGMNAAIRFITPAVIPGHPALARPINGVQVRFAGYRPTRRDAVSGPEVVTAHYVVMGDLNLGSNDAVFGYGSTMLTIEVANNATIAQGALVSVAATNAISGAGGGAAGVVTLRPAVFTVPANTPPFGGEGGTRGTVTAGGTGIGGTGIGGQNWVPRFISVGGNDVPYDPLLLVSSLTGGSGTEGANDYISNLGQGGAGVSNPANRFVGGAGGVGGAKGMDGAPPLQSAGPGGTGAMGQAGGRGPDGVTGATGGAALDQGASILNFAALRAGSGGGAGATPGYGHDGGGGGGGGGGGAGGAPIGGHSVDGAFGGSGGTGGIGGLPGAAGGGGAGAGGIELVVRGRLTTAATFWATGASAPAGSAGSAGGIGGIFGPPGTPEGPLGGAGGFGNFGGGGGTGGAGGNGGGGSGGNIHLVAAEFNRGAGASFLAVGGPGAASGLTQIHAFGGANPSNTRFARYAASASPYRSYIPDGGTSFILGALDPSHTPNLVNLEQGGAPYGRRWNPTANVFDPTIANTFLTNHPVNRPVGSRGALVRQAAYSAWDTVDFIAFNNSLSAPRFSAINATDAATAGAALPNGPQPLRYFGLTLDPDSSPGAPGPVTIPTLGALQVWSSAVEAGKSFALTGSYTPYGQPRRFTSTLATEASPLYIEDRGLLGVEVLLGVPGNPSATLYSGTGDSVNSTVALPITARAGSPFVNVNYVLSNIGNADTRLTGTLTGAGVSGDPFLLEQATGNNNLTLGGGSIITTGKPRGTVISAAVNLVVASNFDHFGPYTISLSGDLVLVGPLFSAVAVRNVGTTPLGVTRSFSLGIANANSMSAVVANQTDLSVRGFTITGPDASAFSYVSMPGGNVIGSGVSRTSNLTFHPTRLGPNSATLNISTDANAPFGTAGTTYQVQLTGTGVVPEISAGLAEATSFWLRAEGNVQSFGGGAGSVGGQLFYAPGLVGQAFAFPGGYIRLPADAFPFPTAGTSTVPFSFETWFATTYGGIILGQQDVPMQISTGAAVPAVYVGLDGYLRVEMFWSGTASPQTSPSTVNDGFFHHVAAVYDGTTLTAYLDGVAYASIPFTQTAYASAYFYQLGTGRGAGRPATGGSVYEFEGLIDEPAIYRRALTAAEVQRIYEAGSKGKSTQPFFSAISKSGNALTLLMEGWPNLRFQLQHTESLAAPDWMSIGAITTTDSLGATGFSITLPAPAAATGFFRAIEVP
jgi:hypothetical protein